MLLTESIKANFPVFAEDDLLSEMEKYCVVKNLEVGKSLIDIGEEVVSVPLIMKGTVKVVREDADGNELLLYYLNQGDTCASLLTCCMNKTLSEVKVTVLEDVSVLMVPIRIMDEWMRKYTTWRNFVMLSYRERMEQLLVTIDSIAFKKMDERLLLYLQQRSSELNTNILCGTHQEIADDLHTSREVISRLLKQLERMGRINLSRNKIEIISLV
ncbi:Crp/Fnr family transcriptional regulator [Carboxylicivirga caseinilyticus]|uniref:Crp/Fnr family transcriptional regulator n=1 Tax=Carboxylicivirga caseinilyticus TaxID=3417572 RepID=UPI003D356DC7|nr:Crp/Fnr family transcriptional regulator [Marinilabiliaceae bacterium A049]